VSSREPSAGRALLLDDVTLANMIVALRPDLAADVAAALERLAEEPGTESWRPRIDGFRHELRLGLEARGGDGGA
jgi:hypothetical protein